MTENELRQKVVDTASAWLGTREYSDKQFRITVDDSGTITATEVS